MANINYTNLTNVRKKTMGVPKTNQEKFNAFKQKNASIETLKNLFDLDIPL